MLLVIMRGSFLSNTEMTTKLNDRKLLSDFLVQCDEAESSCSSGAGLVCLRHESKCNGIATCPDGSDEDACGNLDI